MNALFLRRNKSKKIIVEDEETPKRPLLEQSTYEPEEEEPLDEPVEVKDKTDDEIEQQINALKHTLNRRRSSIPYMGEIKIVDENVEIKRIEIPILKEEEDKPKKKITAKYRS
jgi:uncharacterized membrane protein YgaE (UPF0421/DUF939 family)